MDAKLTLKLNKEIIQNAKKYTKERNISLSRLIENQLSALLENPEYKEQNYSPDIMNLIGIMKPRNEEQS
jgi:hypothetical protein